MSTKSASQQEKEEELPIDIHIDKLIDWLLARSKLDPKWTSQLPSIRHTITTSLAQLPVTLQSQWESSRVTIFECKEIMEKLRQEVTASGAKVTSFFGSYTDANMQRWARIIAAYEKQNVGIAEVARIMTTNVNYEIPAMRKLIATSQKQVTDLTRKIEDTQKAAITFKQKYETQCQQLEIKSSEGHLDAQIERSVQRLPQALAVVEDLTRTPKLSEAIEYYRAFIQHTITQAFPTATVDSTILHTLITIRDQSPLPHDTTSTTSTSTATSTSTSTSTTTAPSTSTSELTTSTDDDMGASIDWGISMESAGEASSSSDAPMTINWDMDTSTTSTTSASVASDDAPMTIDWGGLETTSTSDEPAVTIDWGSEITAEPVDDKVTSAATTTNTSDSKDTRLSLVDASTRHSFLTDVLELESFLDQRHIELSTQDSSFANAFMDASNPILRQQSTSQIQTYQQQVQTLLHATRDARLQQLIMIKTSKRYVERLVSSLRQLLTSSERLTRAASVHRQRQHDLLTTIDRTGQSLREMIVHTKGLKDKLEKALTTLVGGRKVILMGEIANL